METNTKLRKRRSKMKKALLVFVLGMLLFAIPTLQAQGVKYTDYLYQPWVADYFTDSSGNQDYVSGSWSRSLGETWANFSFCVDETPGCVEGFEAYDGGLAGNVYLGYFQTVNKVTVDANFSLSEGSTDAVVYYCYAWNSDGDCTDQVPVPSTWTGSVAMTFAKTFGTGTLEETYSGGPPTTTTPTTINWNYQVSCSGTGTAIGVTAESPGSCFMGFTDLTCDPTSTFDGSGCAAVATDAVTASYVAPAISKLLAGKFPEKVLRRMRALEKLEAEHRARKLQK
jgi:hypothetical protein